VQLISINIALAIILQKKNTCDIGIADSCWRYSQFIVISPNRNPERPGITVIVDAGWGKRSHQHSYNAYASVGWG